MNSRIYLRDDFVDIEVCNTKYFNTCRFIEERDEDFKKGKGHKIVAQILRVGGNKRLLHINVWYWRGLAREDENCGVVIASLELCLEKNQRQEITIKLPKTGDWTPVYYFIAARSNCKVEKFKEDKSENIEKVRCTAICSNEPIELEWEQFPSPAEAKKQFKYIKSHKLVSKFYWDPEFREYDCYCKACATDGVRVGQTIHKWRSWVSNPDIGYVRPVGFKCDKNDGIFKYSSFGEAGKLYEPVEGSEYDRLLFYNLGEYREECTRVGGKHEKFDDIWEVRLHQKDIFENGNIKGGAWRHIETGEIITNADDMNNACLEKVNESKPTFEKVITLGYHRTNPKNAVRCPVCDDLYRIMCRSGYNPRPFILREREKSSYRIHSIVRRIKVWFADRKYFKEHPDDC